MKKFYIYSLIALAVGGLVATSFTLGLFSGFERFSQDRLFTEKSARPDIVVIAIDDESIAKIGQWPWPRTVFADFFDKLKQVYPKAVGLDVVFAEPSRVGPYDDQKLAESLASLNYPVILPIEATALKISRSQASSASSVVTLPEFRSHKNISVGHVNLITDADGVVRSYPKTIEINGNITESFADSLSKVGNVTSSDEPKTHIVYAGKPGTFTRIPFWQILNGEKTEELKNKIVLVGATASDLHDTVTTPVSFGNQMPGVEVQANILNMRLQGYSLKPLPWSDAAAWLIFASFIPALIFLLFRRTSIIILINLLLGIGYIILAITLFDKGSLIPLFHLEAAWLLSSASLYIYRYTVTERERSDMKNVFSNYVSKEVLDHIMLDPSQVKLGGQEKQVTVFFSDIRGFTTISEKLSPTELVRVLNKYFTVMTGLVLENGGVVDKYIGDAIMAFWGAPLDDEDRADKAVQTSIAMLKALDVLNEELKAAGDPEINIGIGLFSGPAVVGNVGSDQRFDYTAMGDTVNAASRLESSNKQYETKILISQSTVDLLKNKYPLKFVDSATVKGRAEPIKIYTLELDKI